MFEILTNRNAALNTEIDKGWPTGWSHQLVDCRVSLGRLHLILHWIDKLPKKNIFQSIFQKVAYIQIIHQLVGHVYSLVPLVMVDRRLARQMSEGIVIRFSIIAGIMI